MNHPVRYIAPARNALFSANERAALERVNERIGAAADLPAALALLFEAVRAVSPCDRIGLSFVEEEGRRVVAHHAVAAYEPLLLRRGYAEDLAGSSLERVIARGEVRLIDDLEAYLAERPASASTRILIREGVRSSMTCPLVVDGRNVGLLFRSSREPRAYDERHAHLHLAMAERIAQAVEKAWRIEKLEAANHAYTEMLGFVAHELKSPLASILTDVEMLTGGAFGEMAPPQRDKVGRMAGKAEYLLNLVRDYLDLARIEGGELAANIRPGVRFAEEVVRPAIEMVEPQAAEKKMRVATDFAADLACDCDPDLMKIVAVNFVGNGVKYGNDGGEVRVAVAIDGDRLRFAVRNEGPGFPPEARSRLFRKFSRLDSPELKKRKGTGVGLYTAWRIVQLHGGRVDARSEPGAWAEFSMEIPLVKVGQESGQ